MERLIETMADMTTTFRRQLARDSLMIVPGLVLVLGWPMFQILLDNRADAFMCAFVLAMAVRFALRFDRLVAHLSQAVSPRAIAGLTLGAGPGILGLLIWQGEPIVCQRFLSGYFLIMAALHGLDVVDGAHRMIKTNWPQLILPRATQIMSQTLVIYYLGMVLLNETLIRQVDPVVWLLYFGLLPMLSRMVLQSLHDSVRAGTQGLA